MVKSVRIVPPPRDDECRIARGTKVYMGNEEIHGISAMDVRFRPDDIVWATIRLACWFDELHAEPRWEMTHPFTGEEVQIEQIVLRGGEVIDLSPEIDVTNLDSTEREFRYRRVPRPCK